MSCNRAPSIIYLCNSPGKNMYICDYLNFPEDSRKDVLKAN